MASTRGTVHSFEQAEEFLAGGRNKDSRTIANNTYVERRTEDRIAIRLHATDVVEFTRSGLIFLNSGGWRTVTTKDRINSFIPHPLRVISRKGQWRVTTKTKTYPAIGPESWQSGYEGIDWDDTVPYADNISFREINGSWEPIAGTFPDTSEEEKIAVARKALEKLIKSYLAKADKVFPEWTAALKENGQLNPAGDPWCCTMGIGREDNDHLWKHLQEHYVFLTIFRIALEDSGRYREPVQRLLMSIQLGWYTDLKRELRKYLLKHLDPATAVRASADKAEKFVEYANDVLTKPEDFGYFGHDEALWVTSGLTFSKTRDSENVNIANFDIVWETLKAEFPDLFLADADPKDENPGGIYVFGSGHWAVGWIDQIVVPVLKTPGTVTADNLHPAFIRVSELAEQTKLYPALPGAEERAAVMDTEQELADIKGSLQFLENTKEWPVGWLNEHDISTAIVQDLGEEYDWSSDQVQRAIVVLSERLAHDENNQALPGQEVLI